MEPRGTGLPPNPVSSSNTSIGNAISSHLAANNNTSTSKRLPSSNKRSRDDDTTTHISTTTPSFTYLPSTTTPTADTGRPPSDVGTSPSDAAYTPSSLHSLYSASHQTPQSQSSATNNNSSNQHLHSNPQSSSRPAQAPPRQPPPPPPINAILAAFANSDLQYSGIMRPHDGVTYDRRQQHYDPSSDHRSISSISSSRHHHAQDDNDSIESSSNRGGHHSHDMTMSSRHNSSGTPNYSPHRDRYSQQQQQHSHMHSSSSAHGHHHSASTGGAPTAPGSSDHSPHNPASHPYDRATPPQPQGYRPYLPSPTATGSTAPGGTGNGSSSHLDQRRDSDVSMATTTTTKRGYDADRDRDRDRAPLSASTERSRQHPWEEGYRQNQGASSDTASAANTAAAGDEPPAKKRRRAKAAPNQDIPEGAEVEYEDPGGDRARGPVFVHPPKGAVQACIRCHRIKRKCDGAWPRCASCARVDVACVFELSAATSSYVHKLKKTNADLVADLRASESRIHALEMQLSGAGEAGPTPHNGIHSEFGRLAVSAASIHEHAPLSFLGTGVGGSAVVPGSASPPFGTRRGRTLSTQSREGTNFFLSDILSRDDAIKCAQTYFDFNCLAYPFLERTEIIPEMLELYDTEKDYDRQTDRLPPDAEERAERRKFLIYMILTIGRSHTVRLGDEHSHGADKALYSAGLRYRAKALAREDILAVQALLLMTLYSTDVPEAGSLWQTLGLAGRIVMAIGLHRRADAHVPPEIAEPRRRVFYSFYNLDRFVASTFSKPLTISEHDIDIELPTDRPTDQPYRGWPIMHICRYIVRYRRLLGCTQTALYSVNGEQNALPEPERRAIVGRLHEELEAWAADGPNPKAPFTIRSINHDKWLAINYHQMLCMLYRPSPLYPDTTPATLRALHDGSSKCVDLYCELWAANKVGFNLIQIVGLFVACISLLCCLCECDTRMHSAEVAGPATTAATLGELGLPYSGVDDPSWAAEIRARVRQCRNLFETFGGGTPLSAKYRDIFTRVSELLLARYGPLHRDADASLDHVMADSSKPPLALDSAMGMVNVVPTPAATPAAVAAAATPASTSSVHMGTHHDRLSGDIAGAWDAMSQLWYDLGDLFGDEAPPPAASDPLGMALGGLGGMGVAPDGAVLPGSGLPGVPVGGLSGMPLSSSGMPGLGALPGIGVGSGALGGLGVASVQAALGVGGGAYPPLGYPYGQYAAYAASYPGPYGEYGQDGFDDSWGGEHWRPEGEGWWGHL